MAEKQDRNTRRTIGAQVKIIAYAKSYDGIMQSLEWWICSELGYKRAIMRELRFEIKRIRRMKSTARSEAIALQWMIDLFGASPVNGKWDDTDDESIAAAVWAAIAAPRIGVWDCLSVGGDGLIKSWRSEILSGVNIHKVTK